MVATILANTLEPHGSKKGDAITVEILIEHDLAVKTAELAPSHITRSYEKLDPFACLMRIV